MGKKEIVFISLLVVAILVAIVAIYQVNSPKIESSPSQPLEDCKTLSFSGPEGLNIVFFSSEETAREYSDYLLETKPFDTNKDKFNFYYIDSYSPECEIYKEKAILCYSKDLVKKAAACPNDHIVVLEERDSKIRSSNYMNVMSINTKHPLSVFPHEFGHSLIDLAEEYVPAELQKKAENCKASCSEFPESKDGCFQGCSKSNFYRSINSGLMRSLGSKEFGRVNEAILLDRLNKVTHSRITGSAVSLSPDCENKEFYLIEGLLADSQIEIQSRSLGTGCPGSAGSGDFSYRLSTSSGFLDLGDFNPEFLFTEAPGEEIIDGFVFSYEGNFLLKVPVIPGSEKLQISDSEDMLLAEVSLGDIGARPCKI